MRGSSNPDVMAPGAWEVLEEDLLTASASAMSGSPGCPISRYPMQLTLTECDVRYHTVLWDNRGTGHL